MQQSDQGRKTWELVLKEFKLGEKEDLTCRYTRKMQREVTLRSGTSSPILYRERLRNGRHVCAYNKCAKHYVYKPRYLRIKRANFVLHLL